MLAQYDITDFQSEVLEESNHIPVLVDFWASWCQPCRILGPILEKLTEENIGKFKLAKVDTEKFPNIATQYGIQGIPAVKLFVRGKVVGEFTGALSKTAIEKFLDQYLPDKYKEELEKLKGLINYGINDELLNKLDKLINNAPYLTEAKILLARLIVLKDSEKAQRLIKNIQADSPYYLASEFIRIFSEFMHLKETDFEEKPVKNKLIDAQQYILAKNYDQAFENLIYAIIHQKEYMNELPRKVCISLFTILGNEHPSTKKYRRRFDMSLY